MSNMKMKFDIDQQSYEGRWFGKHSVPELLPEWPYPDEVQLKIRPYPKTEAVFTIQLGGGVASGKDAFKQFNYCLEDVKGIDGADDKPLVFKDGAGNDLPHAEGVKRRMYDFLYGMDEKKGVPSISAFVLDLEKTFDWTRRTEQGNS